MKRLFEGKIVTGFIMFFILAFGCSKVETGEQAGYARLIKGDWVVELSQAKDYHNMLTFSFQDSLAAYPFSYGSLNRYTLRSDTLVIEKGEDWTRYNDTLRHIPYQYKILKLNSEELRLSPLTVATKELFKFSKRMKFTTVRAKRVTQKNDLTIQKIGFYSSVCYGTCPSMYLEIEANGNFLFHGRTFTDMDGLYRGTLPEAELAIILKKIRNIDFENLKKHYRVSWTDDQTCGVKLITDKGIFSSSAYGSYEEPHTLRLLFDKLIEVYKYAELQSDSTVQDEFLLERFEYDKN